jgi:hypothetical protein
MGAWTAFGVLCGRVQWRALVTKEIDISGPVKLLVRLLLASREEFRYVE